tara:strand:+ start:3732 stop:4682 length:951 start_codon:yes stop_codon:yes gene_type:complete
MDTRTISFCDKIAYNITNDEFKKVIVDKLKEKNTNILDKINYYNDKIHKKELLNSEYIFSYKTKGNNYILFITKINNKKYCFFIDKKINKGYIYPRILLVHYRFKDHIYNDTIFNGELVVNNQKEWYFYICNIKYYCGQSLYKYNIYDKLNNIKNILSNNYISDKNIEPCMIKLKQYYPLNKINMKLNKDMIGIEFIHYSGNKYIFYSFNNIQKKRQYKNPSHLNNDKIFKISKTNNIDIYKLYCMKKKSLYDIGYARIDSNNSNYLYNYFKDKNISHKKTICCNYNKYFKKWTPIKFVDKELDDYFDIKDFLNKI